MSIELSWFCFYSWMILPLTHSHFQTSTWICFTVKVEFRLTHTSCLMKILKEFIVVIGLKQGLFGPWPIYIFKPDDNQGKQQQIPVIIHFHFHLIILSQSLAKVVFTQTLPLVVSVLDGFNVCIFAYGQTGTGKTFTMEGTPEHRGVNYRTLEQLLKYLKREVISWDMNSLSAN